MVTTIKSLEGHSRLSTQELLSAIYSAMEAGETEFEVFACGQHDIGGPLWSKDGKTLKFKIHDPGQRVGSMCMENTEIIIEGSAPADVGWLNAGGIIVVKGDGGDTTAHCAAAGKIYVGGRVGTRSGSLMKHDPKYEPPEFWVLKNAGSFSFEFLGGGIGVVCGYDSEEFESVLGDRACVGMVGGIVYVRGQVKGVSTYDVKVQKLDENDIAFLKKGMPDFLKSIDREKIATTLSNWSDWQKIVPLSYEETHKQKMASVKKFREEEWVKEGIFSDVFPDKLQVIGLANTGINRLRYPDWENKKACAPCEYLCPISIPTQERYNLLREGKTMEALSLIYEYNPFPRTVCGQVCPNLCMYDCSRKSVDQAVDIQGLGSATDVNTSFSAINQKQKVAVIGAGVAGLTAAWHLRKFGYAVTVFDQDTQIGGKLASNVSRERLSTESLIKDLDNFKNIDINFNLGKEVTTADYEKIKKDFDAVVLATGAYGPKIPPWPGKEKLVMSIDFLPKVNKGQKVNVGNKVVVIGAGNTGMDVIFGAYKSGAKEVIAIDVQKPNAFQKEIDHAESLGAKIMWPVFTKEITDKGVVLSDGQLIEADTVILAIGEVPLLSYIKDFYETDRGYVKVDKDFKLSDNVYTIGDMTKLGLLADAIGHGREVALVINASFKGHKYEVKTKKVIDKNSLALAYFDSISQENIEGACKDVDRCISCGTCRDCRLCKDSCPEKAIARVQLAADTKFEYKSDPEKCIGCSICAAVCPCGIWNMSVQKALMPADIKTS